MMQNLAGTLFNLGLLEEAKLYEERVLESRRRIFGPEHPETLVAQSNFAQTLFTLGEVSKAIELAKNTLADATRTLGSQHPITQQSSKNLQLMSPAEQIPEP